ncbi:hypothetical protein [Phosphitispora sp. TUW77]|uniref:hypothetical protein n=1 Tax=Phosphitispora sp. TUW77 TaxID=3152361 RepID=UPI003AB406A5
MFALSKEIRFFNKKINDKLISERENQPVIRRNDVCEKISFTGILKTRDARGNVIISIKAITMNPVKM